MRKGHEQHVTIPKRQWIWAFLVGCSITIVLGVLALVGSNNSPSEVWALVALSPGIFVAQVFVWWMGWLLYSVRLPHSVFFLRGVVFAANWVMYSMVILVIIHTVWLVRRRSK